MVTARRTEQKNITLSMTEFKQQLGELSRRVVEDNATVMVESHGKPKLMVISADRGEALMEMEARASRQRLLSDFRDNLVRIREEAANYDARQPITDEDIEDISVDITREARRQLAEEARKGK